MELDYKGRIFSFKKQKRKEKRRRLFFSSLLIIVLFLIAAIYISSEKSTLKKIGDLLLEGKTTQAQDYLNKHLNNFLFPVTKTELSALANLYTGDLKEASAKFKKISGEKPGTDFKNFLENLSDKGKYNELLIYCGFLRSGMPDEPEVLFYTSVAWTGLRDLKKSEEYIGKYKKNPFPGLDDKLKILESVNSSLRSGKLYYIFDSNNKKIACFDTKKRSTVSLIKGFDFSGFDSRFSDGIKFFTLTLDAKIQELIYRQFGKRHGSFILTDLSDGRIIAAVSSGNRRRENRVFSRLYEPGSTVKLITQFIYLSRGMKDIFPVFCRGNEKIGKKLFYDWKVHGTVKGSLEALKRSCNITFAKIGVSIGANEYKKYLRMFLFNKPELNDLFLKFKTGTFNKNLTNTYKLARISVGLDEIESTTIHTSIISSIIALNGKIPVPFLIVSRKNIFNTGNYYNKTRYIEVMRNNNAYYRIRESMFHVVEDADGTAKRARTDTVKFGVKTGTAGVKENGLDSIVTGFFPYDSPRYSFALRIEHGGKAELAGAIFVKRFIENFYRIY